MVQKLKFREEVVGTWTVTVYVEKFADFMIYIA